MRAHAYPSTRALFLAHVEIGVRVTKCQWQENCPPRAYREFNIGLRAIHAKHARAMYPPKPSVKELSEAFNQAAERAVVVEHEWARPS